MLRFEDLDNFFTQPALTLTMAAQVVAPAVAAVVAVAVAADGTMSSTMTTEAGEHGAPGGSLPSAPPPAPKLSPKDLLAAKRLVKTRVTPLQDRFRNAAKGSLVKADALICKLGLEDF